MTCDHTSKLYFGLFFLILSFQHCCTTDDQDVQCKIINFEFVKCLWHANTSAMNYTFSSEFLDNPSQDCPEYIMEDSYTVGCRIPLSNPDLKFKQFSTKRSTVNHTFSKTFHSLQRKVQLNPPYNLSVVWDEQDSSLFLQWNSSSPLSSKCVVYMVRNQIVPSQTMNVTGTSYKLFQASQNTLYVFQVRSTVADGCGASDLWSDWSTPVESSLGNSRAGAWQGFFGLLPVLLLFLLVFTMCYCERKTIFSLSVVPDPSKNLQDLFHKHDGNVESWVQISRELKEAFEPDYTEPSCDVCEITASCDAGPTPEVSPVSQTDNCKEPSTEERRADEPSTEERRADEPSTEERRADEPGTEERRADEPGTEEPTKDEPVTEDEPEGEPGTGEQTKDEPGTGEQTKDEPGTGEPTKDEPVTEDEPEDEPGTGEQTKDEPDTAIRTAELIR